MVATGMARVAPLEQHSGFEAVPDAVDGQVFYNQ
jgi:hypothetical protein